MGDLPGPILGSKFTIALLRKKLGDHIRLNPELKEVADGERFAMDNLEIEAIPITHSIPGSLAFAIHTAAGAIIHTGDFKIDPTPVDDRVTQLDRLRALGDEGVLALFSDSTNGGRPGTTYSEREVRASMMKLVADAPGRMYITTFASNVHRLQGIIDAAEASGRVVIPVGRSMDLFIDVSKRAGFLFVKPKTLQPPSHFNRYEPNQVVVLLTGCQGETFSATWRIANRHETSVAPSPGDTMIFSARRIPGNEMAISDTIDNLIRMGVDVIDDRIALVHTSGHAFVEEQRTMLELTRPKFFIPSFGTLRLMLNHARTAYDTGMKRQNVYILEDGSPLDFHPEDAFGHSARIASPEHAGLICIDGSGVGDIDEAVLNDRKLLATHGIIVCIVGIDESGQVVEPPIITSRGVINEETHSELIDGCSRSVTDAINKLEPRRRNPHMQTVEVRSTVQRYFRGRLNRRPLVLAVVTRADREPSLG